MNHIVLIHPAIPQNTGNIMRTCVVTNTVLHLIEPLGFILSDKSLKRAGLDYIDELKLNIYPSFEDFTRDNRGGYYFFTRYSKKNYSGADYTEHEENYLFFGHEHDGIPKDILKNHIEDCVRIPMYSDKRSLNLSNCVSIGLYEALRQQNFAGLSEHEVQKGENYLYE